MSSSGSGEWKSFKAASIRSTKRVFKSLRDEIRQSSSEVNEDAEVDSEAEVQSILPTDEYQYKPLPPHSIRLLEILPAKKDGEVIQCRLSAIDLSVSPGRYEAVSYVWGDSDQPRELVSVNDAALEIYETLHGILGSLRRRDKIRHLWVDAICINQEDISERNTQVPLMRNIYKDAERTVVWLGPPSGPVEDMYQKSTKETFFMVQELAEEAKATAAANTVNGKNRPEGPGALPSFSEYLPIASSPVESKLRDKYNGDLSIFRVISCRWWHRAWTVQELLLSRSVVLLRGRHEMEWSQLAAAVAYGLSLQIWAVTDGGFATNQAVIPYASTRALQERLRMHRAYPEVFGITPAEDLLNLLLHCRHREAKDPRDKIYAVLGVLHDSHSSEADKAHTPKVVTEPDYGHPVVYVYRQISQQLIEHTGSLDVLGVCPQSTRRALPSWVTDWSISAAVATPLMQDSMDRPRLTHAAKHAPARARFPTDAVTMVLSGHELSHVDEVSAVLHRIPFDLGPREEPSTEGRWEVIKQAYGEVHASLHFAAEYWKTIFAWEDLVAKKEPSNPGVRPEAVYWQTICAGTYVDGDVAKTEELHRHWLENIDPVRTTVKRYKGFSSKLTPARFAMNSSSWKGFSNFARLLSSAYERRLGWAANGWLCLLPEAARAGDRIILAEGGRVPLVIRPDGDGYNMFVGEAYIQGIMDGEAFEEERCAEVKIC